jgi:competence protein ComEC
MPDRRILIAGICTTWLAGSLLGINHVPGVGWWITAAAALGGVVAWPYRSRIGLVLLVAASLLAGLNRSSSQVSSQSGLSALIGQPVTITGTISGDPTVTPKGFEFTLQPVQVNGRHFEQTIWVFTYPQRFQRGYHLTLQGKLKPGFGPYAAELSFPKTLTFDSHQTWLEHWRQKFFAGIRTALPEPLASFVLGLLVGVRALIPKPLQAELARTGLSHLVAVSGYNLTIIAQAAHRLTGRLGYNISIALTLWLIGGFVVLTGGQASIVRAGVVAILVLAADRYGRRIAPLNLLLIAAALTAAWKPSYLNDLGWLLSFAAFFGIVVLAPAVERRLGLDGEVVMPGAGAPMKTTRSGWRVTLLKLLIESTCAQLMTLPLLMHSFAQLSIIAPLANLIILPLVPLAMLLGLIAGLAGMWLPAFCGWLAWPALYLAKGMLAIISWLSGLKFANLTEGLNSADTIWFYLVLAILTISFWRSTRQSGTKPVITAGDPTG